MEGAAAIASVEQLLSGRGVMRGRSEGCTFYLPFVLSVVKREGGWPKKANRFIRNSHSLSPQLQVPFTIDDIPTV